MTMLAATFVSPASLLARGTGLIEGIRFTSQGVTADNPLGPAMDVIVDLLTSPTAGWDAAKVLLEQGTPVYVGAGADGKLTVATSSPYLARLVDVYERDIVIGGMTDVDSLRVSETAVPEGKKLGVAEKAPEESSFVGKPLDEE